VYPDLSRAPTISRGEVSSSDAELTVLRSFWMWQPLKEKWDFIRDWEKHRFEAMRKFEEYAFGRGGGLGKEEKRRLPLSRWLQ